LIFQELLVTLMIYLKMLLITFLILIILMLVLTSVAFTKFIDKWCDPPIYEDVLMRLFVFTLVGEREMIGFMTHLINIQDHTGFVACLLESVWAWSAGGSQ
jgi:hypothetical protein